MRLKDDSGVLLCLEAESYIDPVGMVAYGANVVLVGDDGEFVQAMVEEQDIIQLCLDMDEFKAVDRVIDGVEYNLTANSINIKLSDITCNFCDAKWRMLHAWLSSFVTFVIHRLNLTDSVLPNQGVHYNDFTFSQN